MYTITLGGFFTELVEACLVCDWPPIPLLTPPSASTSVSPADKPVFSSLGVFHVAISSSSMGETPRGKNGRRRRLLRQQIQTPPTIRTSPTVESTVLKLMTSVLLFAIPEPSLLPVPASSEVSVVIWGPDGAVVSVGIISVTSTSLDVHWSTVLEYSRSSVIGGTVEWLARRQVAVPCASSDPG